MLCVLGALQYKHALRFVVSVVLPRKHISPLNGVLPVPGLRTARLPSEEPAEQTHWRQSEQGARHRRGDIGTYLILLSHAQHKDTSLQMSNAKSIAGMQST